MKANVKRLAALLMAVILLVGAAACSKEAEEETTTEATVASNAEKESKPATTPQEESAPTTATFTDFLVAEKIGTLNTDGIMTNRGGLIYIGDNNLYGIMSSEGLYDTGAIYAYADPVKDYFFVRKTNITSSSDIAALNAAQLLNGKGKPVVPGTFAAFEILNERYVLAATATQITNDESKAAITLSTTTATYVSAISGDGYTWYEGTWAVYDVTTGAVVPGVSGNYQPFVLAYGDCIKYKTATGASVQVNSKGESLPEDANILPNGAYRTEATVGNVYDSNGTLLFNYDFNGYVPFHSEDGYYIGRKNDANYKSIYAIMDKNGTVISEGYSDIPYIYGKIVKCNNVIYNLQGDQIIEGTYSDVYEDEIFGNNWLLYNNSSYTLIDAYGNVYVTIDDNDETTVLTDSFVASKKSADGSYYYYSHKDKDFTIKGSYFVAPWLACVSNGNSDSYLIDTMTGKKLIEGYRAYSTIPYGTNSYYVYAKFDGGTDVYLVTSGSQLENITQIKTNLYDDLAAAFAAEGLTVTVDKVNGAIALDTAVLFGGDSAVLSAEGKEVLNKFVKVYTSVIFSDKYRGFITKTLVEGHTAPLAGSTYESGYSLSLERSTNVMNYCLSAESGAADSSLAKTLEAVGYSNSQPIYNADGSVNLDASRRVSFRFMVNIEF